MFISREMRNQILISAPVLANEFINGLGNGWGTAIITKLQNGESEIQQNDEEASWIASIHEIGRFCSPVLSTYLLDKFGRKITVIIVIISMILTCVPLIFVRNVLIIIAMRVCFGIVAGFADVSTSIYLAENLSPNFRGIAGAVTIILFHAGVSIESILGVYLSYTNFMIANSVIYLCNIIGCFFVKETPYFDMMRDKYQAAEDNLRWLRGGIKGEKILLEIEKMKQNVQIEKAKKNSIMALYTSAENVKAILIVLGLYSLTSAVGIAAIRIYSSMIFVHSNIFTINQFVILFQSVQFLAVCISPFVVERYNRRRLVMVSYLIAAICHGCTTILFYLNNNSYEIPLYPWIIFISVTLCSSICTSLYPVVYTLRSELIPLSVKAVGGGLAIFTQSAIMFLILKTFLVITHQFGMETNFFLFFVMSVCVVFYTYIFLPETRGKSLVDIQNSFKGNKNG